MSATLSNLSNPKYGYDLVAATTQAAINATMKQFLLNYDGTVFSKVYVYDTETQLPVETDYDEMVATLGVDPFSIESGTANTDDPDDPITKLLDLKFMFGFQTTMGLPTPPTYPLSSIPDVLEMKNSGSIVTYNLFCKEFKVMQLAKSGGGYSEEWTLTNLSQSDQGKPWVTSFYVDLDLRENNDQNAFHNLPEDVQKAVKNLNPDSMFSIQQLYLDLNTRRMESGAQIEGLDPSSQAYQYLNSYFIAEYINGQYEDNEYLLGYAIKPQTPSTTSSSIIPTDLNIEVSPYTKDTSDYQMYTLNYLVMGRDHTMPAPVQFEWNWVDKDDISDYHGAMAIRKGFFVNYLNSLLSPSLNSICLVPSASIDVEFTKVTWEYGISQNTDSQSYQAVSDGSSHVLTFSYSKKASDSGTFVPNWGNISLEYSTDSDVYLEGNIIRTVTTAKAHFHINVDGGITDGDYVKYSTETCYEIAVDSYGKLSVTQTADSPNFVDSSDSVDPDGWSEFVTLGQIDSSIQDIVDNVKSWFQDALTGHDSQIESMLQSSGAWVFPGGQTFSFKDAGFSDNQDFYAYITYVDPSDI